MRIERLAAIYSNENFPLPVVQGLRKLGHDVLTIQETDEFRGQFTPSQTGYGPWAGRGVYPVPHG
jgi:hypothetical protein